MPKEFIDGSKSSRDEFQKIMTGKGEAPDWNNVKPFLGSVSKEIEVQRRRIGGNFAVALAIPNREGESKTTLKPTPILLSTS